MKSRKTGRTYIGVVEDINDPKKIGRVKVRVVDVFDETPLENIPWASPWKDIAGNNFALPEKGKVVTVVFENGNTDNPEFIFSDHYNINLEKKLSQLAEKDYFSMKSLMFDHKTQIYVNEGEGLKLDHKFNLINIRDTSININLKDNFGKINLGTSNSTQRAILGDNFLNWFDDFVSILMGSKGGPFLGNLGAPVVATPALLGSLQLYQQLKDPKFLSKNVYIVDNENVAKLERIAEGQIGDTWKSTVKENNMVSKEPVNYTPTEGSSNTTFDQPAVDKPVAPTQSQATTPEPQPEPKPTPKPNPDIKVIKALMEYKSYVLYEDVMKVNIIAVRNQCIKPGDKYSDQFIDRLYIAYKKDEENWEVKHYLFSTVPGLEFTVTDSWLNEKNLKNVEPWISSKGKNIFMKEFVFVVGEENGDPFLAKGLPILAPSQYIDLYYISQYKGAKSMSVISGAKQLIWRDNDTTNIDLFNPSNFTNPEELLQNQFLDNGLKIHLGYPGGINVGNWSEGSQVFSNSENLNDFFNICEKHKEKWGNSFAYTLVTKNDWDEATRIADANKTSDPLTPVAATPSTAETATQSQTQTTATQSQTQQLVEKNKSEVIDVLGDGSLLVDVFVSDVFKNGKVTTDDISRLEKESVVFTIKHDSIPGQWEFLFDNVSYDIPSGSGYGQRVTSIQGDKVVYNIGDELGIFENLKDKDPDVYGNYKVRIILTMNNKKVGVESNNKQKTFIKNIEFNIEKGSPSSSESELSSSSEYIVAILNPTTENSKKVTGNIKINTLGPKKQAIGNLSGFPDGGTIGPLQSEFLISGSESVLVETMIVSLENEIINKYQVQVKLVVVDKK